MGQVSSFLAKIDNFRGDPKLHKAILFLIIIIYKLEFQQYFVRSSIFVSRSSFRKYKIIEEKPLV